MARGRRSPFAKGADGKFLTLAMEAKGMRKAAAKIEAVAKETEKLKKKTEAASSATDANTSSTDKNTSSTERNTGANRDNITTGFTKAIMLQTMTSAINQATGATYKMIAGLEANGVVDAERARQLQETARRAELLTGALEFMLSIQTVVTTVTELDTAAKGRNTGATIMQTKAQLGLNAALRVSPYVLLLSVVVSLVSAFLIFGKGIDNTKTRVELLTDAIKGLREAFEDLLTFENPFDGAFESRFGAEARGRNTVFIRELMGA